MKIDTHELAWAAGFFDGEGSFVWCSPNRPELAMSISQSEFQPLKRFHLAIGEIGSLRGPYKPKSRAHKEYWVVSTHGLSGTQAVLALLWQWLSEPKRMQAQAAFSAAIPYYRQRASMGKGSSKLTLLQVEQLRLAHTAAKVGRIRVPKGWIVDAAISHGVCTATITSICSGRSYV